MPELEPRRPPPFQDSNRSRSFAGIEQRLSPAAVVNTISRSPARSVAIEPVANVAVARLLLTVRGRFSGRPSAPTVYMIPVRSSHVTSSVMIVCGSTTEAGSAFDRRTSRSIGAGNGIPPPQVSRGGLFGIDENVDRGIPKVVREVRNAERRLRPLGLCGKECNTARHCADTVSGAVTARVYFQQDAGANYDPATQLDPVTGYPETPCSKS